MKVFVEQSALRDKWGVAGIFHSSLTWGKVQKHSQDHSLNQINTPYRLDVFCGLFSCSSCFCGWARSAAFIADESLNSTALSLYPDSALSHIWLHSLLLVLLPACSTGVRQDPVLAASFFVCTGGLRQKGSRQDAFLRALSFQMGYRQQTMKPQMGDHTRHKSYCSK